MSEAPTVALLVDDLFRRSAGEITAVLLRRSGGLPLETAEEAVQDAFVKALRLWPYHGIPDNPRGWLYRVAARGALDASGTRRRRAALLEGAEKDHVAGARGVLSGAGVGRLLQKIPDPERVADDELALLLLCCDPHLSRISQVMLTLKVGCGFSVREIAGAFLARPTAVAQRCVRAKRTLQEAGVRPPEPTLELLRERAPVLREVLYLLFTGGHTASEGEASIRADLCGEAVRLGRLMVTSSGGDTPETRALLALFCLHGARIPARTDAQGVPCSLADQDRSLWDRALLAEGFHHLDESARGHRMTRYHLEAGIAAVHAQAPSSEETDWGRIVWLYDELLKQVESPVLRLNRAIALARERGPEAGLKAVRSIAEDPTLAGYHLLPATLGMLLDELGSPAQAIRHLQDALALAPTEGDRRLLQARLARLESAASGD